MSYSLGVAQLLCRHRHAMAMAGLFQYAVQYPVGSFFVKQSIPTRTWLHKCWQDADWLSD